MRFYLPQNTPQKPPQPPPWITASLIALCACFGSNAIALNRDEFALEIPVQAPPGKALIAVELPLEIYAASKRHALADLRVVNSQFEALPFALRTPAASQSKAELKPVTVLPFFGKPSADALQREASDIRLDKNGDQFSLVVSSKASRPNSGQVLLAYYLDLGSVLPGIDSGTSAISKETRLTQGLELRLKPGADINLLLKVEASADLKSWRTLQTAAPIFRLTRADQSLTNTIVEWAATDSRYLRLSLVNNVVSAQALDLSSLGLESAQVQVTAQAQMPDIRSIELTGTLAPASTKPQAPVTRNAFWFDAGAVLPVSKFNLAFADLNSLAPIKLSARSSPDQPWQALSSATIYRLGTDRGELKNADIGLPAVVNASRYWQLEIDERAGEFSTRIPKLKLFYTPAQVIFTARGSPPFTLLVGNAQAEAVQLGVDGLAQNLETGLGQGIALIDQVTRKNGLGPKVIDNSAELAKKWILWSVLLLGVGGLAVFAMRLLKEPAAK